MEVWTNCGEYFIIGMKDNKLICLGAGCYVHNIKDEFLTKREDEFLTRHIDSLGFSKCYNDALIAKVLLL